MLLHEIYNKCIADQRVIIRNNKIGGLLTMDTTKKTKASGIRRLSYHDAKASIAGIMNEASIFKKNIFKTSLMGDKLDKRKTSDYLNAINDFLRLWDEYSRDIANEIKNTEGKENVYVIEYRFVKDFIYAKYDYASVLPFADGIIRGVMSGEFEEAEDIKDFYNHTVSKAFDNNIDTAAGLLDMITPDGIGMRSARPATALDAKTFDSIRNYEMFKRRDRQELYNAINKVVEFLVLDLDMKKYINLKNAKLFVSVINNIIDYITYSLAIYAMRIFIISEYSYPFIRDGVEGFSESTDSVDDDKSVSVGEVSILRDIDELVCRDPKRSKDLINILAEFIHKIGAAEIHDGRMLTPGHIYTSPVMKDNRFNIALINNPLYQFILGRNNFFDGENEQDIIEINRMVKTLIYNNTQGLQDSSSAKHEILHVIKGTNVSSETIKEYRLLTNELYVFTIKFCTNLSSMITMISSWKSRIIENKSMVSNGVINSISESSKILTEFYRDIATAIVNRAKDIEVKFNKCRSTEANNAIENMSLKVPGNMSDDTNNNMMTSVPDTTRIPVELMDMYEQSTYDSLQLYDEYARLILGDLDYYSEAVNMSDLINKILAKLKGAVERFRSFWMDKNVQNAVKWITDHEQDIISMNFNTAEISDVLPYKVNVGLPKNFNNLEKGLSNIKPEHLKNPDELDKFIKSLYPSQEIYNWFNDPKDTDRKAGHLKYRSLILFKEENEVMDKDPDKITLKGSQIQRNIRDWVATVKSIKSVYDSLDKIKRDIESGVNKVKLVSAGINQKADEENKTQNPPAIGSEGNEDSKPANSSQEQSAESNKMASNINLSEKALVEIQLATARLYEPLPSMFVEYTKAMYKYIQEAYSKGRKTE